MADDGSEAMNVRFLINRKTGRIIYAEAGKEFVDLLLSFLILPVASVLKLLSASEVPHKVGSVNNLYDSMEILPPQFLSSEKSHLLDPIFISAYSNNTLRIEGGNYYVCQNASYNHNTVHNMSTPVSYMSTRNTVSYNRNTAHNISTRRDEICTCGSTINCPVQLRQNSNVNQAGSSNQTAIATQESGFVKDLVTFIITDDLKISPASTITSITLINQLNIKDLTDLEERTATVDRSKALEILGTSLISTTVLNDVFGSAFSVRGNQASVTEPI